MRFLFPQTDVIGKSKAVDVGNGNVERERGNLLNLEDVKR